MTSRRRRTKTPEDQIATANIRRGFKRKSDITVTSPRTGPTPNKKKKHKTKRECFKKKVSREKNKKQIDVDHLILKKKNLNLNFPRRLKVTVGCESCQCSFYG